MICIFIVYSLEIKSTINVLMCACTSSKGKLPRGREGKAEKGSTRVQVFFCFFVTVTSFPHRKLEIEGDEDGTKSSPGENYKIM